MENKEIEIKINEVLDKIRPYLENDGGSVKFNRYENGIVYVTLIGACAGCPMAASTLEDGIIGTYDSYGSRINSKTNSRGSISSTTHNYQKKNKIDEKSAMGYYYLWECVKNHIIAVLVFWGIFGGIFVGIGTIFENAYLGFFLGLIVSIAISIGIEKAVKSFYELIRFGKIKGKLFLIVGVLSLLFFLISCYSILEEKEIIEENKQHIIEDPSYSKYANERIEIAENNKDMAVICSISSVVVAVISGGIFVLRNQSKK